MPTYGDNVTLDDLNTNTGEAVTAGDNFTIDGEWRHQDGGNIDVGENASINAFILDATDGNFTVANFGLNSNLNNVQATGSYCMIIGDGSTISGSNIEFNGDGTHEVSFGSNITFDGEINFNPGDYYFESGYSFTQGTILFPEGNVYFESQAALDEAIASGNWNFNNATVSILDAEDVGKEPDSAFVPPICFAHGMMIETDHGDVAVEKLEVGDMVRTYDSGFQPIRFIYGYSRPSIGANRAIIFEPGTIGNHKPVHVSHEHRILAEAISQEILDAVKGRDVDSCRGDGQLLVKACLLVNGGSVRFDMVSKSVRYYHIMFDRHELIYCHGSISESWQPKMRNLHRDPELREKLVSEFPRFNELTDDDRLAVRHELAHIEVEGQYQLRRALRTRKGV